MEPGWTNSTYSCEPILKLCQLIAARVECYANVGAYLTGGGPSMHTRNIPRNFPGPYRLPVFHARTYAVFTNTTPIGA